MKVEFDDGLINFRILFLKAEKVSEFLNFNSKLFHSMTVYTEKNKKKLCLPLKRGMLLSVVIICLIYRKIIKKSYVYHWRGECYYQLLLHALLTLGRILKRHSGDWPLNIVKK